MKRGAFLAALLVLSAPVGAEVRIVDGDTIAIDGVRHRLFGIDTPELGQPGAAEATAHLRKVVGAARPTCEQVDYDRGNRRPVSLCSVRGADLSFAQVLAGHAVVWCFFIRKLRPPMLPAFLQAETEAKAAKRGIWAGQFQPWRDWGCGRTFIRK